MKWLSGLFGKRRPEPRVQILSITLGDVLLVEVDEYLSMGQLRAFEEYILGATKFARVVVFQKGFRLIGIGRPHEVTE